MSGPILSGSQKYIQGEIKPLRCLIWDADDPDHDLSAATATITLYDSNDNVVLTEGSATVTGTTVITVSRTWDSTNATVGLYRALAKVVLGNITQYFEWPVLVLKKPAAI